MNYVICHLVTVLLHFTIQAEIMDPQYLERGNNRRMIFRELNSIRIFRCLAWLLDRQRDKIRNCFALGCGRLQLNIPMSWD